MRHASVGRFLCAFVIAGLPFLAVRPSSMQTTHAQQPKLSNVLYIESNIGSQSNSNSVFAFSNDGNGNLTPLAGSPYLTGGTGFFDPTGMSSSLGSENQVILSKDSTFLYAVNAHTNTIAVFSIGAGGILTPVTGSPFASNGFEPLSLALSDDLISGDVDLLTVANKADDPNQSGGTPNFTAFQSAAGVLTPVAGSTFNLPAGGFPSQVFTTGDHGRYMFGSQLTGTSTLRAFRYKVSGIPLVVNNITAPTSNFFGEIPNPVTNVIYAAMPAGASPQLAVYSWDKSTGALALVNSVADPQMGTCWLYTGGKGTRLYSSDFDSGTVSVWDIHQPNTPSLRQSLVLTGGTSARPTNLRLDPFGKFLYVLDKANLHILNVSSTDGTVSETITPMVLPVPSGEFPIGLATALK
jgi:6-phosphogluconolactonase (cycloisomerase 2 family)